MIDMHMHAVHPNLPGVKPTTDLYDGPVEKLVEALREERHLRGLRSQSPFSPECSVAEGVAWRMM